MPMDDNDRLRAGMLPSDPEVDAEPMPHPKLRKVAPPVGALVGKAFETMERRAQGLETPVPLPWSPVAEAINGGLWPGLHVLIGNTGSGKSQWGLQVALQAALTDVPVLYIGLELGHTDLVARLVGLMAQRRWSRLWLGADHEEIHALGVRYADELARLPLHLEVAPPYGWTYDLLRPHAEALLETYRDRIHDDQGKPTRPLLIVLDFLQLVASTDHREDLRSRIQQAAYASRAVARDLNAAVLLVSSTSRENYKSLDGIGDQLGKGNPARLVGLGKESGEVEYAADTVLVLTREPWPVVNDEPTPPPEGTHVWLAVAKVRAGQTSWVEMRFDGGQFTIPAAPPPSPGLIPPSK